MIIFKKEKIKNNISITCELIDHVIDLDLDKFFKIMKFYYSRNIKFYLIVDLSKIKKIPIKILLKFTKFMKVNYYNNKKYVISSGILIKNNITKMLINIAFKIQKPASPYIISNNIKDINNFLVIF